MMVNQFRINNNILLKLNKSAITDNFWGFYGYDENNTVVSIQNVSEKFVVNETNLFKTVWYKNKTLNKVFNNLPTIDYTNANFTVSTEALDCTLLLRQGFSWENVFGILVIVKAMGNTTQEQILISQIFDINSFNINYDNQRELINGSFWTAEANFSIPNTDKNIMISTEVVYFNDVTSSGVDIGKINNYPLNDSGYEPLIGEKLIPDYIQTNVQILNNQYLKIQPITLELNRTLEQSILDFFNLTEINIIPITIEHLVRYGNDTIGYKNIKISNLDNKYGPINIGLDLTDFINTPGNITIFVSTEIICDNKLMKRENVVYFDYNVILNPITQTLIENPQTVYPLEFKTINNIENTIIETKKETKIVPILQPVFVEIINENFKYENKLISFNEINIKSMLLVKSQEEQFILSSATAEGKIFFDLNTIKKPDEDCEYQILNAENNQIIKTGKILI